MAHDLQAARRDDDSPGSAASTGVSVDRLVVGCVEHDRATAQILESGLSDAGHATVLAGSGAQAIRRLPREDRIDVLVLGTRLPDMDGWDLSRSLRAGGLLVPTMFLTPVRDVEDIVRCFEAGGSDYLMKPFALPELVVRVEVLARRRAGAGPTGGLRLDVHQVAICFDDRCHQLTPTEYRMMAHLLTHRGRMVRREALVGAAWPPGARVAANTFDTYLYRLREHLRDLDPGTTIRTIRGMGYVLRDSAGTQAADASGTG